MYEQNLAVIFVHNTLFGTAIKEYLTNSHILLNYLELVFFQLQLRSKWSHKHDYLPTAMIEC